MPSITEGSSAVVVAAGDSTLTLQNPGGFGRVENSAGVTIWEGGQASVSLDLRAAAYTVSAVRGSLFYDLSSDATPSFATRADLADLRLGGAGGRGQNRVLKRMLDVIGVTSVNSGTAATITIDATSPFGRPAYKIAMPAGNTYNEVQLAGLNLAKFDGHVIWRVWVEDYTAVQQIQAFAGMSGYTRFWQTTHNINNSNTNRFTGEHAVVVGPLAAGVTNTFVAGIDTFADTKLRIFPGGSGANVWVDAVVVPAVGRPTHCLTHDDCSVTWMTQVLPVLAAAGLQGTFGINTGDIGGSASLYLSSAQVAQIAAAGHQISPHNVTNTAFNDGTGGTQTAAQYTADFVTASAALSAIVGAPMDSTYHPWVQGRCTGALMDTMRAAGMRVARGTDGGYNFLQAGVGMHALQLKSQALHTLTQAQIATICDNAKKYGCTVVWTIHEVSAGGGAGVETSAATYAFLVNRIAADIAAGAAVHRKMGELARELYAERLVAASIQA